MKVNSDQEQKVTKNSKWVWWTQIFLRIVHLTRTEHVRTGGVERNFVELVTVLCDKMETSINVAICNVVNKLCFDLGILEEYLLPKLIIL